MWLRTAAAAAVFGCASAALAGGGILGEGNQGDIRVLSGPPDLVSGTDALVQINASSSGSSVRVTLNGRDITSTFQAGQIPGTRVGLVTGLTPGSNILLLRSSGRLPEALEIITHPIGGPVFSGPQQQPFICTTTNFALPDGTKLGPALDSSCNAAANVQYLYMPTGGSTLKPYNVSSPPADLSQTTTIDGNTVNYIVRLETGTLNRGIYQIAFLHQPTTPLPSPTHGTLGWNGNVLYAFGGGCGAAYNQGLSTGGVVNNGEIGNDMLKLGYAQITSTLNVLGNECNDVISAETAMMVKEYFIKHFGAPKHTIGFAGSGASMQQHLLSENYPHILDGIVPERSFPDILTMLPSSADCPLLVKYFPNSKLSWTDDQKAAVSGYAQFATCSVAWFNYEPRWINPRAASCSPTVPSNLLYDPTTNPTGARCDYFTNAVNAYGIDRKSGSAGRVIDNEGVQYGLAAFNQGKISAAQFIELNSAIGGFDNDANFTSSRSKASEDALRLSYQTGRMNEAVGMNEIPILDVRSYVDKNPVTIPDVHMRYTSFSTRARLTARYGSAANQVMWTTASEGLLNNDLSDPNSPLRQVMRKAIPTMTTWLDNIDNDRSNRSRAIKVVRNKPAGLADACFTTTMQEIVEPATYDGPGRCNALFPSYGDPRTAAGEPIARDILKCQLKPLEGRDYHQQLTGAQLAQLRAIFPKGVCDYTRPGVEQQLMTATWLSYQKPGVFFPTRESVLTKWHDDFDLHAQWDRSRD
jgi:hypothetical protein